MTDEGERLAKRVAALVPCSRREAEQYIAGGWVRVDGQVVEEPQFRVLGQRVTLDAGASLLGATPAHWVPTCSRARAAGALPARRGASGAGVPSS